jgi:transposase
MLAGIREQLVAAYQLSNAIRGYAAEFGITAAKSLDRIGRLLAQIARDESVPALASCFAVHDSRRLAGIPAVGPVDATALVMKTPDPHAFPSGRRRPG